MVQLNIDTVTSIHFLSLVVPTMLLILTSKTALPLNATFQVCTGSLLSTGQLPEF